MYVLLDLLFLVFSEWLLLSLDFRLFCNRKIGNVSKHLRISEFSEVDQVNETKFRFPQGTRNRHDCHLSPSVNWGPK